MSGPKYPQNFSSWRVIENTSLTMKINDIIAKYEAPGWKPSREPWVPGSWKWKKIREQHLRSENDRLIRQRELRKRFGLR